MAPFGQPEQPSVHAHDCTSIAASAAGGCSTVSKPTVAFGRLIREPTLSRRALNAHDTANNSSFGGSSSGSACDVQAVGLMSTLQAKRLSC
jgi:hypothetical protein